MISGRPLLLSLSFITLFLISCYAPKWNTIGPYKDKVAAPTDIQSIFNTYENGLMVLDMKSPASNYRYDIGEKDRTYGQDSLQFRFTRVEIRLLEQMPVGKVLVDFNFIDKAGNQIEIKEVDLLRLTPQLEGPEALIPAEMLEKEFNRFGFIFRREHKEFKFIPGLGITNDLLEASNSIYRCKVTNNCLGPGKWELELSSEDYSDFSQRFKSPLNLNQNKIIAHSWFNIDLDLYAALMKQKNRYKNINLYLDYEDLSNLGEQAFVDFDQLRNPLGSKINTEVMEFGYESKRALKPLDIEQEYKKQFGLFLNEQEHTYASILETPVMLTQFRDEGFYRETNPRVYDYSWMKHLTDVELTQIDIRGTDSYVQIELSGEWSPYKLTLGNVDLTQVNEQKLLGFLFGVNTYPKNRRYNPQQNTLAFDADLLPDDLKPFLLLTDNKTGNWVNNQYKGIEKVYISYESLEQDILEIYVLSYERIIPVWMCSVKLPKTFREQLRIRKSLYNY